MYFLDTYFLLKYAALAALIGILCFVLRIIIWEIVGYLSVMSYSKIPGVATFYYPIAGFPAVVFKGDPNDMNKEMSTLYKENSDKHMIIANAPNLKFGKVCALLVSAEATKEFLMIENGRAEKLMFRSKNLNIGFVGIGGQKALNQRSIFIDYFLHDRIQSLFEPMMKIIDGQFEKFVKENTISKTEFKKIDLRDFFNKLIMDWMALLLFGLNSAKELEIDMTNHQDVLNGTYHKEFPKTGENTSDLLNLIKLDMECIFSIGRDPLDNLLLGLPYKLGLKKIYRSYKALNKLKDGTILGIYNQRYNETPDNTKKQRVMNVLDLMIEHNRDCLKNNNKEDFVDEQFVIGNLTALLFGAFDTSLNSSMTSLM